MVKLNKMTGLVEPTPPCEKCGMHHFGRCLNEPCEANCAVIHTGGEPCKSPSRMLEKYAERTLQDNVFDTAAFHKLLMKNIWAGEMLDNGEPPPKEKVTVSRRWRNVKAWVRRHRLVFHRGDCPEREDYDD